MNRERELMQYLLDIRERSARMEEKLDLHVEQSAKRDLAMASLRNDVDSLKEDVITAKASLTTLRWLGALLFITVPTTILSIVRILKNGS